MLRQKKKLELMIKGLYIAIQIMLVIKYKNFIVSIFIYNHQV
jgi:hypothetical protein